MYCIEAKNLNLRYCKTDVIQSLNIKIKKNKITTLIGSNGCGKSTLLKSFARLLSPSKGQVVLDGKDIHKQNSIDLAKRLSMLSQTSIAPEGLKVYQLVRMGRYPHQSFFQQYSQEDERIVNEALKNTNTYELKDKEVDSLSGGQRQRVWIAMILAQDSDILLLDEPTTYLDLSHQIDVLDLLVKLNEKYEKTIIMVLHDLNLACRYSHELVAVHEKNIYSQGVPSSIITEKMVKKVFDLKCKIIKDPYFGTPLCIPFSKNS